MWWHCRTGLCFCRCEGQLEDSQPHSGRKQVINTSSENRSLSGSTGSNTQLVCEHFQQQRHCTKAARKKVSFVFVALIRFGFILGVTLNMMSYPVTFLLFMSSTDAMRLFLSQIF